jgi:WD40 repeat protein
LTSRLAAAAFSPDGELIAVQGFNGSVRVWKWKGQQLLQELKLPEIIAGHGGGITFVPGSPLRLAVGTEDSVHLYRCTDWTRELAWRAHPRNIVSAVAVSPDGRWLVTGACFSDPVLRVWDTATGESVAELEGHTSWISTVLFSRDGRRLFAASADQSISVWQTGTWQQSGSLRGHTDEIWGMNLAGDGLVTCSKNGEIMLWPGGSPPQATGRYEFHRDTQLVLEAGDGNLIEVRADKIVRCTPGLWNQGPELPLPGEPLHGTPTGLIVFRAGAGRIGILDAAQQPPLLLAEMDVPDIERFCADQGNRWLAFSHAGGAVTLFDIASRQIRKLASVGEVHELSADEARGYLVVRTPQHVLRCDPSDGHWLPPDFPVSPQGLVLADPRFRWLAQLVANRTTLFRISPFERVVEFDQENNTPSLGFSADGRWLAIANEAAWARLWRLPDAGPLPEPRILRGHLNSIFSLTFTPDSSRLVTLCSDREAAKFWDPETGMELLTLVGNETFLYSSRLTRNGETLLAHRGRGGWQAWHAPSLAAIAKAEEKERW